MPNCIGSDISDICPQINVSVAMLSKIKFGLN